jgi:DNA sulfur modification protein DndE
MKDIPGEAILFDMYYMAKDPVPLVGEKRTAPKVELLPVTEATPQFRDFYINDVVCNGAAKGIFIRGLPEMPVSGVHLKNITLNAVKAIECQEARDISFSGIRLQTRETDPLIGIRNSRNISFDSIRYDEADVFMNVEGEGCKDIKVTGTDIRKSKEGTRFSAGATASVLQVR